LFPTADTSAAPIGENRKVGGPATQDMSGKMIDDVVTRPPLGLLLKRKIGEEDRTRSVSCEIKLGT